MRRGLKSLNSWTIWILAFFATCAAFAAGAGIVFLIAKRAHHGSNNHDNGHANDHGGTDHGGGHGAESKHDDHGGGHGTEGKQDDHGGGHGAEDKQDDHEKKADHKDTHDDKHNEHKSSEKDKHQSGSESNSHNKTEESAAERKKDKSHWSYEGSTGPSHWAELEGKYSLCGTGRKQSPIDIDETRSGQKLLPIRFRYKISDLVVSNNGHAVQVEVPGGQSIEVEGERYDLLQFHFHIPSEHKVAGAPYDMEMHLVHKSADGRLAVVGVLFEEGAANKKLDPILQRIPDQAGGRSEPAEGNVESLLPARRVYFKYDGSLTTPPCSEDVTWMVLSQPMEISSKQIDQILRITSRNARPVQKLYGRNVMRSAR